MLFLEQETLATATCLEVHRFHLGGNNNCCSPSPFIAVCQYVAEMCVHYFVQTCCFLTKTLFPEHEWNGSSWCCGFKIFKLNVPSRLAWVDVTRLVEDNHIGSICNHTRASLRLLLSRRGDTFFFLVEHMYGIHVARRL